LLFNTCIYSRVAYLPSSETLEKRGGARRGAWTWLRLDGVSFTILPFEERDSVLRNYAGLLSSVKRGVLLARRVEYEYKYSDYSFSVSDTAFYLKTPAGSQVVYFDTRPDSSKQTSLVVSNSTPEM
jgi:hypothetical protein